MRQQGETPRDGQPRAPDSRERLRTWWPELRGHVQQRWSRLNDEWLDEVDGRHDRLAERLREAYGVSETEADRQIDDFVETHWNALSARRMSATDAKGTRARTGKVHEPGPTGISDRGNDDSGVGMGTIGPGGRKI